jgi:hypothetical protein
MIDVMGKAFVANDLSSISRVQVPGKATLAKLLKPIITNAYNAGRAQVKEELGRQGLKVKAAQSFDMTPEQIVAWLAAKSEAISEFVSEGYKQEAIKLAFRLMQEQNITEGTFKQALIDGLRDIKGANYEREAIKATNEVIGTGRIYEADLNKDSIERTVYSALMDGATCSACEGRDEEEVDVSFVFPNSDECSGTDNCRCMGIYVLPDEGTDRSVI